MGKDNVNALEPEDCKVVVIPFGLEETVSYKGGTSRGPSAILEASQEIEFFDEEFMCEAINQYGISTLEDDAMDYPVRNALDQLDDKVEAVLQAGKFPMVFGGEHTITAGAIKPFARRYNDLMLLHFDAHSDLRDSYRGNDYSHACAIRRVLDDENIGSVSVGIRNTSAGEMDFINENNHRIFVHWGKDRRSWDPKEIVKPLVGKTVYLTFDVDGFDSSQMAATGTPQPGGFFWEDAMDIIKEAAKTCNIVGADIVELSPREGLHSCDFLAAKLVYKILSYIHLK